jgi:hypothetical protein
MFRKFTNAANINKNPSARTAGGPIQLTDTKNSKD